jgi:hypothetical protein
MAQVYPPTTSMRVYYSSYHLWAARHSADQARRREQELTAPVFDFRHRAHVTATVISCGAFLEAAVNELFVDAADGYTAYLPRLTAAKLQALRDWWNSGEERRSSMLKKCETALTLLGGPAFSPSANPYEDTALLIRLRNELVHFKPMTRDKASLHGEPLHRDLAARFLPNPLMSGSKNPYFPDHCLGSGCANWPAIRNPS